MGEPLTTVVNRGQQILFFDFECSEKDLDKNRANLKKYLSEFEKEDDL